MKTKLRVIAQKAKNEALKLSFAVVITEVVIVGVFYLIANSRIVEMLPSRKVEFILQAQAKESPEVEIIEVKDESIERMKNIIWTLESTKGKNNYSKCTQEGKINGIGYGISGNGNYICFEDHEAEMAVLERWIKNKQAQGITGNRLLCYYNTGTIQDSCDYSDKAQMVK